MMNIKVITLFSGYDSQCMGLDRLKEKHPDFDYELLAWSEIDKFAIQAHNIFYPQWTDRNLGDVSKIDWEEYPQFKDCDLLTYSYPCTNISSAGKQAGMEKGSGTASSLVWECERHLIPIEGGVWIDAYNKITNRVAGTIKARIGQNNLYFVTELNEIISSDTDTERRCMAREHTPRQT